MTLQQYVDSIKDKRIAVIGIGVSNTPLIELLCANGCDVTACDKRSLAQMEGEGERLMALGAKLKLGEDYLEGINMLSNMRLCSNVPAQSIVQTALGGIQSCQAHLKPGGRLYEQREFIYNALCDIPGVSVVKPKAAFYIFPKLDTEKFHITDDMAFAHDLLVEKGVLIVQGTGFNWPEPDHFRIGGINLQQHARTQIRQIAEYQSHKSHHHLTE